MFLDVGRGDPLHHRGKKLHGLEGLLWLQVPERHPEGRARFVLLQGQMLVAQVSILEEEYESAQSRSASAPEEALYRSLYEACLFAGRFANPTWSDALSRLPIILEPTDYLNKLKTLRSEIREGSANQLANVPAALDETLGSICALINRGITQKDYRKKSYYGRGPGSSTASRPTTAAPAGLGPPADSIEFITRTFGTAGQRRELEERAESPEDHLPRRDFILTHGGQMAASHYCAALDRENQLLPGRITEPPPGEYLRLLRAMRAHPEKLGSRREAIEFIAWTETVLWLSCSANQATELRIAYPETPIEASDFLLRMSEDANRNQEFSPCVRVRAIEPPYESEYFPVEGERRREDHLELPDLGGLSCSIRELLRELDQNQERPEARLNQFAAMP